MPGKKPKPMSITGCEKGDPIKDWTNPELYKDHGSDDHAWAWEFLRRNKTYQNDYKKYQKFLSGYNDNAQSETPKPDPVIYPEELDALDRNDHYFYPPLLEGQLISTWFHIYADYISLGLAQMHHLSKGYYWKWGMEEMVDPLSDEPPAFAKTGYPEVLTFLSVSEDVYFKEPEGFLDPENKDTKKGPLYAEGVENYDFGTGTLVPYSALMFNLAHPIEPQIAKAKKILMEKAKDRKKQMMGKTKESHQKNHRVRYLRFIDAYYTNVHWKEMLSLLSKYDLDGDVYRKVRDRVKQAYEVVSKKYRVLIT